MRAEISHVEGVGAINFLTIDDISAYQEGECLNQDSIVPLEHQNGKPIFPEWSTEKENTFLEKINKSGEKWVVIVDWQYNPSWVMDADGFLRAAMFNHPGFHPIDCCHEPIFVTDKSKSWERSCKC